jgi:hypothetical protein
MQDEQPSYARHCDWEPCHKRIAEFCFVCSTRDDFCCDSICAEPDLGSAEPQSQTLQ